MTSRVDNIKRMNDSISELEIQIARTRDESYNSCQIMLRMLEIKYQSRDRLIAMESVFPNPRPLPVSTSCCSEPV